MRIRLLGTYSPRNKEEAGQLDAGANRNPKGLLETALKECAMSVETLTINLIETERFKCQIVRLRRDAIISQKDLTLYDSQQDKTINNLLDSPKHLTSEIPNPRKFRTIQGSHSVSPLCQTMTTNLSIDHLLCVFDLLHEEEDLKSLCLCCKQFNSLVQPRIFYRMEFAGFVDSRHKKSITFRAFRQRLERSPHLAHYPRDITIKPSGFQLEDMVHVLGALTGKRVSLVSLPGNKYGWRPPQLRTSLEKLFQNTLIPLTVNLCGLSQLSASCLSSMEHVILYDCVIESSTGTPGVCMAKTISIKGDVSLGAFLSTSLPRLTHFMLDWESPSGEPEEWYAELGTALANMPKLELLTVQYRGTSVDLCSCFVVRLMAFL